MNLYRSYHGSLAFDRVSPAYSRVIPEEDHIDVRVLLFSSRAEAEGAFRGIDALLTVFSANLLSCSPVQEAPDGSWALILIDESGRAGGTLRVKDMDA